MSTHTILIIEDEKPLSDALSQKLRNDGLHVLLAEDGVSGLEIAQKENPDLILLDIVLPKLDGLSVLEQLKSSNWGKTIPVIMLTNVAQTDAEEQSKDKGAIDFLVKTDWRLEEVSQKVKTILGAEERQTA
jgi:DNA-binding response OmpR family regulator